MDSDVWIADLAMYHVSRARCHADAQPRGVDFGTVVMHVESQAQFLKTKYAFFSATAYSRLQKSALL